MNQRDLGDWGQTGAYKDGESRALKQNVNHLRIFAGLVTFVEKNENVVSATHSLNNCPVWPRLRLEVALGHLSPVGLIVLEDSGNIARFHCILQIANEIAHLIRNLTVRHGHPEKFRHERSILHQLYYRISSS